MAIIKHVGRPQDHYTMIPNAFSRDKRVTPRAARVYIFVASQVTGWSLNSRSIATQLGMSRDTVNKAMRELESLGWMRRAQQFDENSKFSGVVYEISTVAENLGHVAENVGTDNVGTEDLGHIKKTNSFKKTSSSKKTKTPALSNDWRPTAEQWSKLKEKHEGKDIDSELEKFRDWHIEKKSQYKDWSRAFDNWLKRARPSRQQLPEVDYVAAYGLEDAPF